MCVCACVRACDHVWVGGWMGVVTVDNDDDFVTVVVDVYVFF